MGDYKFSKIELQIFNKKETKARKMKNPLVLMNDPKDLANLLFQMLVLKKDTYYKTKTSLRLQQSGKLRSVEDMYRVVINYHTNITYKKFFEIIYYLSTGGYNKENKFISAQFASSYCNVVRKEVYWSFGLHVNESSIRNSLGIRNIKF